MDPLLNIYLVDIPRIGFLIAAFMGYSLMAFAFGRASSSPLRNSFIVSTFIGATFNFTAAASGILRVTEINVPEFREQTFDNEYGIWLHVCWFFLYWMPFGYLYFYYCLANRPYDAAFRLMASVCALLSVSSLFTEKMVYGGEWSTPILAFVFLPCFLYGIVVCFQAWWTAKTKLDRHRNGLILMGIIVPIFLFILTDLIMDKWLGVLKFSPLYITASNGIFVPVITGIALTRYGLLKEDLSYAAEGLFLHSEDPVLLVRPDRTIARANPIAEKLFGLPSEMSENGVNIKDVLPEFDEHRQNFNVTINTADQQSIFACSNSMVLVEKTVRGQILLFRDVTREIELNSMKTEFTSTVSHELRTPLTSILGFAKIIEKRLVEVILPKIELSTKKDERAVKQVKRNLNVIVSEGQRLTQLINDVLDISKMEAGKLEWKFQRIQLSEVLEPVIARHKASIEEKGLFFAANVEENLPEIIADPSRMDQVLENILMNSIKFTSNGRIQLDVQHKREEVRISIKDTGVGIEEHDLDKIFQKYQQVGDVLTDKPTGTGLGLPISREIIDSHGGKINVKSIVDVGSEFEIVLPLPASERKEVEIVSLSKILVQWSQFHQQQSDKSNTIVIVEDETHIRDLLRQALEPAGFEVVEARDGVEGVEVIRQRSPKLAIVDVMMPRLNGFEVVTVLKNNPQTMNLPIVMLTVVDEVQRGYGLGVDLYLKKPVEPQRIVEEVKKVLASKASSKTTMLLGDPGYGSGQLQERLLQAEQQVIRAQDLDDFKQNVARTAPDLVYVESDRFAPEDVFAVIGEAKVSHNMLVKFVAND